MDADQLVSSSMTPQDLKASFGHAQPLGQQRYDSIVGLATLGRGRYADFQAPVVEDLDAVASGFRVDFYL